MPACKDDAVKHDVWIMNISHNVANIEHKIYGIVSEFVKRKVLFSYRSHLKECLRGNKASGC